MEDALALLRAVFDRAATAGHAREVWWRDDDATAPTSALDRLVALAARHRAPVAVAAIPARTSPDLLAFADAHGLALLQHGVAHHNHEQGGKPAELGPARPADIIVAELLSAREPLAASPSFLPVVVPPWNRFRPDVPEALAAAGYRGLSAWGGPAQDTPLRRVDTHIDPVAWRGDRSLQPGDALAAMVAAAGETSGPIGLLTHHLVHTEAVWLFVESVCALVSGHAGARWRSAADLFAPAVPEGPGSAPAKGVP